MANASGDSGNSKQAPILIIGGTGFVGRNLVSALAGRPLRLVVRNPGRHAGLAGEHVEIVVGDITDRESLLRAATGCSAAINLVAIIKEDGAATFDGIIRQGTVNAVEAAKQVGVPRFIQMSAMGAMDNPAFPYMQTKFQAEEAVKGSGLAWTIFRPSVIFGPGDEFINTLAKLVKLAPVIPVVGTGKSKFQPVSVKEVAECFVRALDDSKTVGQTYDLGGPDTLEYSQLLDVIAAKLGKKKLKVNVPIALMRPIVKLSKPLPAALRPPVTEEQLKMLSLDNCSANSATSRLIGRAPLRLQDGIDYIVSG